MATDLVRASSKKFNKQMRLERLNHTVSLRVVIHPGHLEVEKL